MNYQRPLVEQLVDMIDGINQWPVQKLRRGVILVLNILKQIKAKGPVIPQQELAFKFLQLYFCKKYKSTASGINNIPVKETLDKAVQKTQQKHLLGGAMVQPHFYSITTSNKLKELKQKQDKQVDTSFIDQLECKQEEASLKQMKSSISFMFDTARQVSQVDILNQLLKTMLNVRHDSLFKEGFEFKHLQKLAFSPVQIMSGIIDGKRIVEVLGSIVKNLLVKLRIKQTKDKSSLAFYQSQLAKCYRIIDQQKSQIAQLKESNFQLQYKKIGDLQKNIKSLTSQLNQVYIELERNKFSNQFQQKNIIGELVQKQEQIQNLRGQLVKLEKLSRKESSQDSQQNLHHMTLSYLRESVSLVQIQYQLKKLESKLRQLMPQKIKQLILFQLTENSFLSQNMKIIFGNIVSKVIDKLNPVVDLSPPVQHNQRYRILFLDLDGRTVQKYFSIKDMKELIQSKVQLIFGQKLRMHQQKPEEELHQLKGLSKKRSFYQVFRKSLQNNIKIESESYSQTSRLRRLNLIDTPHSSSFLKYSQQKPRQFQILKSFSPEQKSISEPLKVVCKLVFWHMPPITIYERKQLLQRTSLTSNLQQTKTQIIMHNRQNSHLINTCMSSIIQEQQDEDDQNQIYQQSAVNQFQDLAYNNSVVDQSYSRTEQAVQTQNQKVITIGQPNTQSLLSINKIKLKKNSKFKKLVKSTKEQLQRCKRQKVCSFQALPIASKTFLQNPQPNSINQILEESKDFMQRLDDFARLNKTMYKAKSMHLKPISLTKFQITSSKIIVNH